MYAMPGTKGKAMHQAAVTMTCWSTHLLYLDIHQSLVVSPDLVVPGVADW